jgi:hypothetical protein
VLKNVCYSEVLTIDLVSRRVSSIDFDGEDFETFVTKDSSFK